MNLKSAKYNLLIKTHKDKIYGYAFLMLKNKMDADDITQEVLIKIWQNINNFKLLSAKSWIFRTTYNLCIDVLRKKKRERNIFEYSDGYNFNQFDDESGSENPCNYTHAKMLDREIKSAIQNLPVNLRSVLILYEIQDMKYREIAKILNIPLNSVKVYLMRARNKLKEELNYEPQEVF